MAAAKRNPLIYNELNFGQLRRLGHIGQNLTRYKSKYCIYQPS